MFLRRRKNLCEHTAESGKIPQGKDGIRYSTHGRLRCPMIFFKDVAYIRSACNYTCTRLRFEKLIRNEWDQFKSIKKYACNLSNKFIN